MRDRAPHTIRAVCAACCAATPRAYVPSVAQSRRIEGMAYDNRLRPLAFALGLAVSACAAMACGASDDSLIGVRADGLTVVCEPAPNEGRYVCDPQPDGGSDAVEDDDACATWPDGGGAIVLWPPNHKLEVVTLADCSAARAGCGAAAAIARSGKIIEVTSDEPLDAKGDGDTESGDLAILSRDSVALRSERQGGGDGRVYRIVSADDAGRRDICEVHVPHDRGPYGGASDSGVAVRRSAP